MQAENNIPEPVVDCAILEIKIKDEDPLSIPYSENEPILKHINQGGLAQSIKQELPEVSTSVYQHTNKIITGPGLVLTPVPLVPQNATITSNTPTNTNNISKRSITSLQNKSLVESFEIQRYKDRLIKYQKVIKNKSKKVKSLQSQNRRLRNRNVTFKELLKMYKQKQFISESVLKDIAKNSKIANMLISQMMSNDN